MMLLHCPHCGPRNVNEFHYLGESASRPDPATATITTWREYLYVKQNPMGWTKENWYHRAGCRQHFTVERDVVNNVLRAGGASC